MPADLRIEPWTDADVDIELRANIPEMTVHLGGPESESQILARHGRFLDLPVNGTGRMFRIALPGAPGAGSAGYWEREWHGSTVYEMGWMVLPEYQGRGVASAAVRLAAAHASAHGSRSFAHAYPKIANVASNAVCRKAGFVLLDEVDFEYPKGTFIRANDWRLDLRVAAGLEVGSSTSDNG
jgi:RimJ/RimL family protein N-acetyltransferase